MTFCKCLNSKEEKHRKDLTSYLQQHRQVDRVIATEKHWMTALGQSGASDYLGSPKPHAYPTSPRRADDHAPAADTRAQNTDLISFCGSLRRW